MAFGKYSPDSWVPKYNFSPCYCKTVVCQCVDSLVCRLRNYAKKLIFQEFVRQELTLDSISSFDHFNMEILLSKISVFLFSAFVLHFLGPFMFAVYV